MRILLRHRFNFVDFDDIGKHKGGNIDILGRATSLGTHARDPLEKREILLTNDRGQNIGAVSFIHIHSLFIDTLERTWFKH